MVPPCLPVPENRPLWSCNGLNRFRLIIFAEKAILLRDSGEFDLVPSIEALSGSHLSLPAR